MAKKGKKNWFARAWKFLVDDFTTTDWVATAISLAITIFSIIWWGGISIELITNFKQLNSNTYFDYIQVALQLFTVTLVGGIFERSKGEVPPIVKKLFSASVLFLIATVALLFLNSSRYFNPTEPWLQFITGVLIAIAFFFSIWGFIEGSLKLLLALVDYRNKLFGIKTWELESLYHPEQPLKKKKR